MFYVTLEHYTNNVFVAFSWSLLRFLVPSCIPQGVISGSIKSVYAISSRNVRLRGKHFRNFIQLPANISLSRIPCTWCFFFESSLQAFRKYLCFLTKQFLFPEIDWVCLNSTYTSNESENIAEDFRFLKHLYSKNSWYFKTSSTHFLNIVDLRYRT